MTETCRILKTFILSISGQSYSITGLSELPFPERLPPLHMTTVVYQVEPEA